MATILAHITVAPGKEREFEDLAARLVKATHDNETRVIRYEYWRGAEPNTYYGLLAFQDYNAFLEHQTSDHHETDAKKMTGIFTDFKLEWLDPITDASPLPSTNMQPLIDGASELWKAYHDRMPAQVAAWWLGMRK